MTDTFEGVPTMPLVVGGSRGIGRATVLELARRGVKSAFIYLENDKAADEVVAIAADLGPKPIALRGDIGTDANNLVTRAIEELGGLDLLAVTAVPIFHGRLRTVEMEVFERAHKVVVWGFIEATRAAVPALAETSGSVVGVTSIGSTRTAAYYGVLGPAKAALESAARYLALELGREGVRVNTVSPGLVDMEHPEDISRAVEAIAHRTPMRRLVTPEEVASVIVSLGSSAFRFVTGQNVIVDGGYGLVL